MRIKIWRWALLQYLRHAWGKSMERIHRKGPLLIVLGLNKLHHFEILKMIVRTSSCDTLQKEQISNDSSPM